MYHEISPPSLPSLVAQIGSLYHRIFRECDKSFREQNFPLQMDQIPVLMSLYYSGGASQKVIGTNVGRDKASINRTVSVLLKQDFVKVIPDTIDKRKTRVELTAAGEELAKQADAIVKKFDLGLSAVLTEQERKEFDKIILKLIGAVMPL